MCQPRTWSSLGLKTKWQTLTLTVKMYVLLRTHSENHVDKHASVPLRYSYITHVTHADGGNIYTPTHIQQVNPGTPAKIFCKSNRSSHINTYISTHIQTCTGSLPEVDFSVTYRFKFKAAE